MNHCSSHAYSNMLKRGSRIALRAKVNDASISGLTIVDSILPVGRGQRQLILGDRYTGKTSIFPALVIIANRFNFSGSIDAFGSKRSFCIYVGINQNPSKLAKLIDLIRIDRSPLVIATHAPTSAPPSLIAPLLGRSIAERLRNKGAEIALRFDDPSKHPKSYRQTASIQAKIPSRDAPPSDILNVHSASLERSGKLKYSYFGGSISAFPIIETINNDTTEFIATNIIPITDGQSHTNKKPSLYSYRPAIDSALPASRIGSAAQCNGMKVYSVGIKNLPTNYLSSSDATSSSSTNYQLVFLNVMFILALLGTQSSI